MGNYENAQYIDNDSIEAMKIIEKSLLLDEYLPNDSIKVCSEIP
jgi:hypothetical protein